MNNKKGMMDKLFYEEWSMALLTLIKVILLYWYTGVKEMLEVILITIPFIVLFYSVFVFIKSKRKHLYMMIMHSLFSVILFVDMIYYAYYGSLPSIKSLFLVGALPVVLDSFLYLLKPLYFTVFLDLIPVGIYLHKNKSYLTRIYNRDSLGYALIIIILILLTVFSVGHIKEESWYVYDRYGVYAYHIHDIYHAFRRDDQSTFNKDSIDTEDLIKEPEEKKQNNKYFGEGASRNIIVIQFESLQNFAINDFYEGQEIVPNINQLITEDSLYFSQYYQQVGMGNTSDAEFASHNALYPMEDASVYMEYPDHEYYTLPSVLKEHGYSTLAFHGFKGEFWNREKMYPSQGFDDFMSLEDFNNDEQIGLGLSDASFFRQSLERVKTTSHPYYAFLVTLTSHHPYKIHERIQEIDLLDKHKDTLFGNYMNAIHYTDKAIGQLIESLKEEGMYENSIIVIYGDHMGLYPTNPENKKHMTEHLGYDYNIDEAMNVPLIIHIPGWGQFKENERVGGQIDFFPTMLNLMGIEDIKMMPFGKDLNNTDEGFVGELSYIPKGSFIDDNKIFIMPKVSLYKEKRAWDLKTKEPIDIETCTEGYERSIREQRESKYIIENNLIKKLIK